MERPRKAWGALGVAQVPWSPGDSPRRPAGARERATEKLKKVEGATERPRKAWKARAPRGSLEPWRFPEDAQEAQERATERLKEAQGAPGSKVEGSLKLPGEPVRVFWMYGVDFVCFCRFL